MSVFDDQEVQKSKGVLVSAATGFAVAVAGAALSALHLPPQLVLPVVSGFVASGIAHGVSFFSHLFSK